MTSTNPTRVHGVELVLQVTVLLAVTAVVFAPHQELPVTFATVPPLGWAALRLPWQVVATELAAFGAVAATATWQGFGPFAASRLGPVGTATTAVAYVVSVAAVVLALAVTVRRRRQLATRATVDGHLFRRSFTESPLGMLLLRVDDDHFVVEELNASASEMLGVGRDDAVGRALADVVVHRDPHDGGLLALLAGRLDTWHGAATVRGRAGSRIELTVAALPEGTTPRLYSAMLLDVTREHDAQRLLGVAHRLQDATLDTAASIVVVVDAAGTVVRANRAATDVTGLRDDELVGLALWDTGLGALSRSEIEAVFVWPNRSGLPVVTERTTVTAAGRPATIVWNARVVRDEDDQPSHAVLTGTDVTAARSNALVVAQLLAASISTALVGVDVDGRITFFNAGAEHMLGWSADEMVGRPFGDVLAEPSPDLLALLGDDGESTAGDRTWRTRTGETIVVSMTLSRPTDYGSGLLCVGRDVTAERETQQRLVETLHKERAAIDRLHALDRAKDEFVSTISHELRTPVTSIVGYTEMLRDGSIAEAQPAQQPLLEKIARNGDRLVAICDDLLLLGGFDTDAALGAPTRVDLRSCVTTAVEAAPAGDVRVVVAAGPDPVEVTGDRAQLDRLVANLVGNAVKFTGRAAGAEPDGEVRVSLEVDGDDAVLDVRDTGIGIPADDVPAVFERFFRSEQAQLRAVPGTGLGLPIVAAVVQAHGGVVTVESEPGRGSLFRVRIPLTDARTGDVGLDVRRGSRR